MPMFHRHHLHNYRFALRPSQCCASSAGHQPPTFWVAISSWFDALARTDARQHPRPSLDHSSVRFVSSAELYGLPLSFDIFFNLELTSPQ